MSRIVHSRSTATRAKLRLAQPRRPDSRVPRRGVMLATELLPVIMLLIDTETGPAD